MFFDQRNAFSSIKTELLNAIDEETLDPHDVVLGVPSNRQQNIEVECADGNLTAGVNEGLLQGHQPAPLKYVRAFSKYVWNVWKAVLQTIVTTTPCMVTLCPVNHVEVNLASTEGNP